MSIEVKVRANDGPLGRMRGDILFAKQLPHTHQGWGKEEGRPAHLIVRIDGIDLADFKPFEGRHISINPDDPKSASKRSKYRLNLDNLSQDYAEKRPHLIISKDTLTTNAILRAFVQWQLT